MATRTPPSDPSRRAGLSLRHQIVVLTLLMALVPTLILGGVILYQVPRDLRSSSSEASSEVLLWVAAEIEEDIEGLREDTLTISQYPPIHGLIRSELHGGIDPVDHSTTAQWRSRLSKLFRDYLSEHPEVTKLRYLDEHGRERVRVYRNFLGIQLTPESELQDKSHRPYFQATTTLYPSECHVSPISDNLEHGKPVDGLRVFRMATPIHFEGGFAGAVVMNVDPERIMRKVMQFESVGSIVLALPSGEYMHRPEWSTDGHPYTHLRDDWPSLVMQELESDHLVSTSAVVETETDDRRLMLTAIKPSSSESTVPWIVGLEPDDEDWQASRDRLASLVFVSGFVLIVAAGVGAVLLGRRLTHPLTSVMTAVTRITEGESDVQVEVHRNDELGVLSDSINTMAREIDRIVDVEERSRRAEEATRAKSEFLANMSHEIRTPITAIVGYAELLGDDATTEDERLEYTGSIQRSSSHLLSLVNDVLDLSKVEAGKLEIELIATDPAETAREVAALMRVQADEVGTTIDASIDEAVPAQVVSDPTRLRQIMVNLVGNAVKFTERGTVRIEVTRADVPELGELRDRMRFDVIDSGVGIPADKVDQLFDSFTQADTSTTREFGGTGLGLAISRRLARLMGGDLEIVRSAPGEGTQFRLDLPCMTMEQFGFLDEMETEETADSTSDPKEEIPGSRILLIEDGVDNQRLISTFVRAAGAEVDIEENGQLGLDAFVAAQSTDTPYDLIISDMQMPVMDGYEATRRVRATGTSVPIIALTAHAMASDRARCLDAGCDEYLSKPINRDELVRTVGLQLRRSRRGESGREAA